MKNKLLVLFLFIIGFVFVSCEKESTNSNNEGTNDSLINITIFYTNDEHGWFEDIGEFDGAAGLSGLWDVVEGYDSSDNYLILSGGDMWTGAAASTWFKGESMVEVMNAMEYDASAIGNHEFDFTVSGLNQRLSELEFPLLAANIKEKSSGNIPSFAEPYIIETIDSIKVGILGLASLTTPWTTFPANVADYDFTSYSDAINTYAPQAIDEGADVLILISHLCESELEEISDVASANGIVVIGGGHCHQVVAKKYNDVILIEAGAYMKGYVKVNFNYNVTKQRAQDFIYSYNTNDQNIIDSDVKEIVDYWMLETDEVLSDVIGYNSDGILKYSTEMFNLVTDSWFYTFPDADITITNAGGIRQDIAEGDITLGTIVGLMPFDNYILELELTGSELKDCINGFIFGGMTVVGGWYLADGSPIEDQTVYTVLTTDYLYSIPENKFSTYDSDPYNTSVNYRQPLIDWLESMNTSSGDPLEIYIKVVKKKLFK